MESAISLYKAELMWPRGLWCSLANVDKVTAE